MQWSRIDGKLFKNDECYMLPCVSFMPEMMASQAATSEEMSTKLKIQINAHSLIKMVNAAPLMMIEA